MTYSPSVPGGATGGATWSKKPSFSSYMWNSTVFDQTSGFDTRVWRTWSVNHSPRNERSRRVLVVADGVLIQLTLGSVPARTSAAKSSGKVGRNAFR